MQKMFEEYGKVIIVVFAVLLILGTIFGGVKIIEVMGGATNVESSINHADSENAVKFVADREKPTISVADAKSLHLYTNQVFQPLSTVACSDADGAALVAKVKNIVFIDGETGAHDDVTEHYNSAEDKLDISTDIKKAGALAVTFEVSDDYNITTIKTISYVIDEITK